MNRVTKAERIAGHTVHYISDNDIFKVYSCPGKITGYAILRLTAYEDTGLEPEEIEEKQNEAFDLGYQSCLNYKGLRWDEAEELQRYREIGSIDRLRELAQAEKEGRLVVLPAEKIFELTWDAGPNCDLICPVSINGVGQCDFCENGKLYIYERTCRQEHIEHIGKTVFLTREAAEAALEKRGAEHDR